MRINPLVFLCYRPILKLSVKRQNLAEKAVPILNGSQRLHTLRLIEVTDCFCNTQLFCYEELL